MIGELTGLSQELADIYFVQVEEMLPLCGITGPLGPAGAVRSGRLAFALFRPPKRR